MNNIILIGFMGVGKGTVAREFAKMYDFYAIDTDDLIESLENRKIKDIFESDGEAYFRDLEKKTAKWLAKNVQNAIISTGGGFFMQKNLKKIGVVVLLDSSFDAIYQRILTHPNAQRKLKKRPLFTTPQKAKEIYAQRVKGYKEVADIVINVENKSAAESAAELKSLINL